jgi:hypothetical protein
VGGQGAGAICGVRISWGVYGIEQMMARRIEIRAWLSSVRAVSAHPLLLLVVGALLTTLLIPRCTRDWQRYEKELDLKSDLVGRISTSSGRFIIAVRDASDPFTRYSPTYDQDLLDRWQINGEEIASELQLYFPGSELSTRWLQFVEMLKDCYDFFASRLTEEQFAEVMVGLRVPRGSPTRMSLRILLKPKEDFVSARDKKGAAYSWAVPGEFLDARELLLKLISNERAGILRTLLASDSAL